MSTESVLNCIKSVPLQMTWYWNNNCFFQQQLPVWFAPFTLVKQSKLMKASFFYSKIQSRNKNFVCLQVNMQKTCLENSSMKPIPSLFGSTPCRSGWTACPSASHSWTPKRRNVSSKTRKKNYSCSTFVWIFNFWQWIWNQKLIINVHLKLFKILIYILII